MGIGLNIFLNKKILIYGLGKSGLSAFEFLKNKNNLFLYDDFNKIIKGINIKKNLISYKNILKTEFDQIILSPGIDINKCKLSKFLKKNDKKIYTDLDVFYSFIKIIVLQLPEPMENLQHVNFCMKFYLSKNLMLN